MTSQDILYSPGRNDECMTLPYAVWPITKYLPKGKIIWLPFDKEDSAFYRVLSKDWEVKISHIDNGQDFFTYEPDEWDIIVSNPPFTGKRKIFERALSFNKPFALIMANTWLNDSAPKQLFKNKDLQLLMFDRRMLFENRGKIDKRITFSSSYYCFNLLPKQIIMETLENMPKICKNERISEEKRENERKAEAQN